MAPCLRYSLIGNDKDFIDGLEKSIREITIAQNKFESQEEYFRLLQKGEYNAAVISVFRYLEITIEKKFGAGNLRSSLSLLGLLNTNTKEDKENLQRAKEYLNVRNQVVHTEIKIKEKKAVEIVNCITSLCEAINNGRIIIL